MSDRIKRLAREIQQRDGIKYTEALRIAAASGGHNGNGHDGGGQGGGGDDGDFAGPERRRLDDDQLCVILTEIAGRELLSSQYDYYAPLASPLVKRLFLNLTSNGGEVQLALYPGDTLSQARVLYHRQDVLHRLRALGAQPGWAVSPNFHFGYVGKGMCWPSGPLGLDGYIELFKQRIDDEYELHADDWDAYWAEMVELGVFDPTYRDEFDAWFTNTNRRSASPRPGLAVTRHWPLDEAEELHGAHLFEREVKAAITDALLACSTTIEQKPSGVAA